MVGGDGASEGGTVFRGCVKNPKLSWLFGYFIFNYVVYN